MNTRSELADHSGGTRVEEELARRATRARQTLRTPPPDDAWAHNQRRLAVSVPVLRRRRRARRVSGAVAGLAAAGLLATAIVQWWPSSNSVTTTPVPPAATATVQDAPAVLDPSPFADDGRGCATMGWGRKYEPTPSPPPFSADYLDALEPVFAARTATSRAWAFRKTGEDTIFLCTSSTAADSSGASSGHITVTRDAAASLETASEADGGIVDFYGYAADDVSSVLVTTPDGATHPAAIAGNVWWAAPVLPAEAAALAADSSWQALDRDGRVVAHGTGLPR